MGAFSAKSDHNNDQGSKDSDKEISLGSGLYNLEVAAATDQRNDNGHLPVDADEEQQAHNNKEQVEVANVVHPQSLPNFIGGCPTVVTTVLRRGDGGGKDS